MAGRTKKTVRKTTGTSTTIVKDKFKDFTDKIFAKNPSKKEVFIDEKLNYFFYESQAKRSLKNYKRVTK